MGVQTFQFDALDADVILQSCEPDDPSEFRVHRCILAAASPFFHDMFTLPQTPTAKQQIPVISVAESRDTLRTLLEFVYPIEDPTISSLDELVPVLGAAVKYDFAGAVGTLRKLLVSPQFVEAEPTRVYAIACRFDLEDEARIASKYTLNVHVLDAPLSDDLKFITAYSYHRLLDLHQRRVQAALAMLKIPGDIKCMQCNGSSFSVYATPKWWYEFERRAREELSRRPTTEVIFGMEFLAQVVIGAGCPRCAGSILDAWRFLQELKRSIDELPATI
ncbi:hypothetical protein LshimejAT787_0111150 [Lyophyllum shimeji]|uniref:BTB domain-containing protein n=1 Tax=Lyophyllum shimeji TaxID=47721 RepID=A0A9P3PEY3_LYOSH|nr:hypothetical protein LshimejAT787_0111150 [Lyophyllum shimeji]